MVIPKKHLLLALDMLTEGAEAHVAEAVRAEAAEIAITQIRAIALFDFTLSL